VLITALENGALWGELDSSEERVVGSRDIHEDGGNNEYNKYIEQGRVDEERANPTRGEQG